MTATTHPEYNVGTEALEVAAAFPQSIKGKSIIVTGVNKGGIGYTTAQAFASQAPTHLILAGRTQSNLQTCVDAIKANYPNVDVRILILDLSSQKAVRAAAKEFLAWEDVPKLDIIVNSAGIMGINERTINEHGIEAHLATNHIGHFLFTNLIISKILKAAASNPKGATRIINVSSAAAEAQGIRWSDPTFLTKNKDVPEEERPRYEELAAWGVQDPGNIAYNPIVAYSQSKAANVLYGIALTDCLYDAHGVLGLALHPGTIMTELGRYFPKEAMDSLIARVQSGEWKMKTLEAGASTSLVAAVDPALGKSEVKDGVEGWGAYLSDCQISPKAHPRAKSRAEAERLWVWSEELVGEKFSW